MAAEEFWKSSQLTLAIQSGFEAINYELQLLLEVTMIPKGTSFVLGVPMNSKSATYNVFQAEPFYQPNDDGKTASVYQFTTPYVAIATDNANFAELAASTLQQCTGSNRIKLCRKVFRPLPMKRYSVSRRCILMKTSQHSEIAPFPPSPSQKPHRQFVWQMTLIASFLETPRWTLRTIAEQTVSLCPLLIVRHASLDQVVKVLITSIKVILCCQLTWKYVKRLQNHTSQQSN